MGESESVVANLLFVLGPTASGKTDLAIAIAQRARAEIISADSVQFYRELEIGSARPTHDQMQSVRHHLIGHIPVADDYTAGAFERDALNLINDHPTQPFVVCGGSGFYVQALQNGMYPIEKANPAVQAEIEADIDSRGLEVVYGELQRRDPESAAKISKQDRYRIVRSLEILHSLGGQKLSEVRRQFEASRRHRFPGREIRNFVLKADRSELAPRIVRRTQAMLQAGLVQEVRALIAAGLGERPALQSVGYKETVEFLESENISDRTEHDLADDIVQGTLRLAKKQRTWFSRYSEKTEFVEVAELSDSKKRERWIQMGVEFLSLQL